MSTKGFTVVGQAAGRCTELTAGYQARDLLKEVSDALSAFLKVCLLFLMILYDTVFGIYLAYDK